ncbi:MAG: YciI family protein [Promethearchaeota archaeon]
MPQKQHFYGIIKPYRKDFITDPKSYEEKVMSDHFNYLKTLLKQNKLFLVGPTLIPEGPFGVIILETETEEEARDLLEKDPSVKLGIQKITDFRPIRLSLTRA